jgi:hypothetical protein
MHTFILFFLPLGALVVIFAAGYHTGYVCGYDEAQEEAKNKQAQHKY